MSHYIASDIIQGVVPISVKQHMADSTTVDDTSSPDQLYDPINALSAQVSLLSLSPQHNAIPQSNSTQQYNSSQQQSSIPQSSSSHQLHREHLENAMRVKETAWVDATSNKGLEYIRDIPDVVPLQDVDEGMICDIQRIASRLVSKAPQLIGIINNMILCKHLICYKQVISLQTLRKVGCMFNQSLIVGNKSIEAKVGHGRLTVLEQG